jgi:hypothetical protein
MGSDLHRSRAGLSAEPAHLLVHQDIYVVPLLLQQVNVEHPSAGPAAWEQDIPDFSNHGFHLLAEIVSRWGRKRARQINWGISRKSPKKLGAEMRAKLIGSAKE